jgi:anti-anti-sigma regulatory factor
MVNLRVIKVNKNILSLVPWGTLDSGRVPAMTETMTVSSRKREHFMVMMPSGFMGDLGFAHLSVDGQDK